MLVESSLVPAERGYMCNLSTLLLHLFGTSTERRDSYVLCDCACCAIVASKALWETFSSSFRGCRSVFPAMTIRLSIKCLRYFHNLSTNFWQEPSSTKVNFGKGAILCITTCLTLHKWVAYSSVYPVTQTGDAEAGPALSRCNRCSCIGPRASVAPRHGVWVYCLFFPDTPCAWEFSRNAM